MRVLTGAGLLALLLASVAAGCGIGGVTGSDVDAFVAQVQAEVPQTQAYGREALENLAYNVCTGNADIAIEVLDDYPRIPAGDRETVARIASETVCGE
jgi:hypothetical protein